MSNTILEAPFETCLLNRKENIFMPNNYELFDMIFDNNSDPKILNEIREMTIKGLDEFYSQSVRMLVAGMSHEMKSPLQSLSGSMEIMHDLFKDEKLDKSILNQCIEIAEDSRVRINNIMNVMSICGKQLNDLNIKPVVFENLIYEILSSVKYREEYKTSNIEIKFKNNCDGRCKDFFTISSFVYHILINIISNACNAISSKNNKNGLISIYCNSGNSDDDIFLDITDNGIGMKEDQFEKIFMPFYSHRLVKNSHGLGLFVAKTLAHKINGDIFVKESRRGKTTIRVCFKNLKDGVI